MRLRCLESGHALRERVQMKVLRLLVGLPPIDVIKTCLYRPRFFGKPFLAVMHGVLRGPSRWAVSERELMASFVASRDQCVY